MLSRAVGVASSRLGVTDCWENSCSVLSLKTHELSGYMHIGVGSAVQLPFPWGARRTGVGACKLSLSVLANRLHCLGFSVPFRLVLFCFSVTQ